MFCIIFKCLNINLERGRNLFLAGRENGWGGLGLHDNNGTDNHNCFAQNYNSDY